jgi:transcriptional regulator with GAF, ATPase, and Fis domain
MSIVMEGTRRKDEVTDTQKVVPIKPESKTENKTDPTELGSNTEILEESLMAELDRALDGLEEGSATTNSKEPVVDHPPPKSKVTDKVEFNGKIFNIIHSRLDHSKLLRAIVKELQSIVTIDLAVLMTKVRNKPGHLRIDDLIFPGSTTLHKGVIYSCEDSSAAEVLKQKNPLVFNMNGSASSGIEKEMLENHGIQSCLYVPILSDDTVSGILILGAKKTENFSDAQDYIDWIASGLSLAIERNRLSSVVAKQQEALGAVQRIGLALVSRNYDVEKVLNFSMNSIRKIMNVEAGTLFLKEKDQLKVAIAFNSTGNATKKFRLKIGQGVAGYVAAKGKPMMVNDTKKSSQFFQEIDKLTGFKTHTALCVPLLSQNKLIGVLEVLNKIDGNFEVMDETILLSLADSIILALKRARLHGQTAQSAHR